MRHHSFEVTIPILAATVAVAAGRTKFIVQDKSQRSTNAGAGFTDMTDDAGAPPIGMHPRPARHRLRSVQFQCLQNHGDLL